MSVIACEYFLLCLAFPSSVVKTLSLGSPGVSEPELPDSSTLEGSRQSELDQRWHHPVLECHPRKMLLRVIGAHSWSSVITPVPGVSIIFAPLFPAQVFCGFRICRTWIRACRSAVCIHKLHLYILEQDTLMFTDWMCSWNKHLFISLKVIPPVLLSHLIQRHIFQFSCLLFSHSKRRNFL